MIINSYYYALTENPFRWKSNCLTDSFHNIKDTFDFLIKKIFDQANLTLNDLYLNNRVGLIVGSSLAELNTEGAFFQVNEDGESNIYSPGYLLRILQKIYEINGLSYALSNTCVTGIDALTVANNLFADNKIDYCVLFLYDYSGSFIKSGFESYNLLSSKKSIQPFDNEGRDIVLQEGAATVVLLSQKESILNKKNIFNVLSAYLINDAYSITSFSNDCIGIKKVINCSLKEANLTLDDITAVFCSTNGVFENDIKYIKALNDLGYQKIITSIKHVVNHTLGVSSVLEMIISVEVITQGHFNNVCYGYKLLNSSIQKYKINNVEKKGVFMIIGTGFSGVAGAIIYEIK